MEYKGVHREIYPYQYDETYCVAFCTFRKAVRTFRIDRMRSMVLGEMFNYDNVSNFDAKQKLVTAKNYKYKKY